jgi:hypothetical protein
MSDLSLDEKKAESSRLEPIKISWITDFTLICPDRDILVVRECLASSSKMLAATLEDKEAISLSIPWKSPGIVEVMKSIHSLHGSRYLPKMMKGYAQIATDFDILEFCFKYDIEPLFSELKAQCVEEINTSGSDSQYIKFFHRFKNQDKTEIFADQTNAIRLLVINNTSAIHGYFSRRLDNHIDDIIDDYEFIIKGLSSVSAKKIVLL